MASMHSTVRHRGNGRPLHQRHASLLARRGTGLAALAGLVLLTAAAAPEREGAAGLAIIAAMHDGAQDISNRTEGSNDQPFTWVSWTEGTPDHRTIRLVLVRQTAADGPAIAWGVQRPDGYGAVLRPTPWQVHGHPVLILQYQFGAAYTRMELYAADADGKGRMLGQVDGSLIGVERGLAGVTLRAYDDALLRGRQRCFGWQAAATRLVAVACPSGGTSPP